MKNHPILSTVPIVAPMAPSVNPAGTSGTSDDLQRTPSSPMEPTPKAPVSAHPKSPQSESWTSWKQNMGKQHATKATKTMVTGKGDCDKLHAIQVSVIIVAIPRDMPTKSNHLRQFNIFYLKSKNAHQVIKTINIMGNSKNHVKNVWVANIQTKSGSFWSDDSANVTFRAPMGEFGQRLTALLKNSGTKQASSDVQMFEGNPGLLQLTQLYKKNVNPVACKNHDSTMMVIHSIPQPRNLPNPPTSAINAKRKNIRSVKMLVATQARDLN